MKVLNIATCFDRHEDDVITPWLTESLRHVKALGHEVEILTSAHRGLGDQTVHGFKVFRFRYFPARWERLTHEETAPDRVRRHPVYVLMAVFYVLAGAVRAFRLARKRRYDIIHVHWPLPHAVMGWAAKAACGAKLVSTFHGVEITWVDTQLTFLRPFLRWVLRVSDAITVNSSFTAKAVASVGKARVHVIPFGAGMPIQEAGAAPRAAGAPGPAKVLFVGRLVERKGVRFLLEALAEVRHKVDVTATIVGDGPLRRELEELAAELEIDHITSFPGVVSTAELRSLFEEADLFVLPAVVDKMGCTEGLGVVLIEAMGYGKPVVASAVGGIPDVVVDGVTGRLVEPGACDALARAMTEILSNPGLRDRMGRDGRERAHEVFSWDAIAEKIEALYRSLLTGPSGGRPRG